LKILRKNIELIVPFKETQVKNLQINNNMEKIDYQITSIAGEFLTVGKLFKRGMQASLTLGNAKGFNLAERQITRRP
jgi:hypothetical protein